MNRFESLFRPITGINPIIEDKYITFTPPKTRPTQPPANSKVDTGTSVIGTPISIPISGGMGTLPLINLPVIGTTPNPANSKPLIIPGQEAPSSMGYIPYVLAGGLALYWIMNRS